MSDELNTFAKKRKSRKIRRYIFLGILVLALLGVGAYFAATRYFIVKEVVIQDTALYSKENLIAACKVKKNTPLYQVSKKEISRAIEENFPYLEKVKTEFDLPDRVVVSFTEEFGEFALQLGTELFSVDRDLNVLAKERPDSTIPRIGLVTKDAARCIVGEKLSFFEEDIKNCVLDLYTSLEKGGLIENVTSIDVSDKFALKVTYQNRFEILVGENRDLKYKFAMVKKVIEDLNDNDAGRIDITDPNTAYVKLSEPLA